MRIRRERLQSGWILRCIAATVIISVCAASARPQEIRKPSIIVQVLDQQGGAIAGASVTIKDSRGVERSGATNQEGKFVFSDLTIGNYALRATAQHFRPYDEPHIQVGSAAEVNLTATLRVAGVEESIAVFPDPSVAQVAEYVGGSLVIRGDALVELDGPGGLEALLRALALRTSGPFGPVALVDGFADAQLPPTYSIREIRINDNPFSAEYSTLGLGRIEMLTKPGSQKFHAETFGMAGDALFNSRNPFSPNKARYESQIFGGNASG